MRPWIFQLAHRLKLKGHVYNCGEGVITQVWGHPQALHHFVSTLEGTPLPHLPAKPPLAQIERVELEKNLRPSTAPTDFSILSSQQHSINTLIPADTAICPQCLNELFQPQNRRYRYPFIQCVNCGPRFSITRQLPIDRHNTSMKDFTQCPECESEYHSPQNRRHHSQSNCCPQCGPQIWFTDNTGAPVALPTHQDAIQAVAYAIKQGHIVAIKSVGGFHLTCDATNANTIAELRNRKKRPSKPFAVLTHNCEQARLFAQVSTHEQAMLESNAAPIVLLTKNANCTLAAEIAPNQNHLGVMIAHTPLQHLLMHELTHPIVLTSGNIHGNPQCINNASALKELNHIADYFVLNDLDIANRCDDSVVRITHHKRKQKTMVLRRAKGMSSKPIPIATQNHTVLALGGQLKSTFCLLKNGKAIMSQHLGDLENPQCWQHYQDTLHHYLRLFEFEPECVAIDCHPNYATHKLGEKIAKDRGIELVRVQHHHAHIAACLAEHQFCAQQWVLGIALDGTGHGDQGALWGAEFLKANGSAYKKVGGFASIPLIGATQAIRQPWRNFYASIHKHPQWIKELSSAQPIAAATYLATQPLKTLDQMVEQKINTPNASSCGRLFDGVAAALGLCRDSISYEGQAAAELEALALTQPNHNKLMPYQYNIMADEIYYHPMWSGLLKDLKNNTSPAVIAARFHLTVISAVCELARQLCHQHGLNTIALGGGSFQNTLLLNGVYKQLSRSGFNVLYPSQVPTNDGGIALGQAFIASTKKPTPL